MLPIGLRLPTRRPNRLFPTCLRILTTRRTTSVGRRFVFQTPSQGEHETRVGSIERRGDRNDFLPEPRCLRAPLGPQKGGQRIRRSPLGRPGPAQEYRVGPGARSALYEPGSHGDVQPAVVASVDHRVGFGYPAPLPRPLRHVARETGGLQDPEPFGELPRLRAAKQPLYHRKPARPPPLPAPLYHYKMSLCSDTSGGENVVLRDRAQRLLRPRAAGAGALSDRVIGPTCYETEVRAADPPRPTEDGRGPRGRAPRVGEPPGERAARRSRPRATTCGPSPPTPPAATPGMPAAVRRSPRTDWNRTRAPSRRGYGARSHLRLLSCLDLRWSRREPPGRPVKKR